MTCQRCHEETGGLHVIATSSAKTELWCSQCTTVATHCAVCGKLTANSYGYLIERGLSDVFVCPENLLDWSLGQRTQGTIQKLNNFLESVAKETK